MTNYRKVLYPLAALLLAIVLAACAGTRDIESFDIVREDGTPTNVEFAAIGDEEQLAGRVTFTNQTVDSVIPALISWSSSDEDVVTVNNGLITAVDFGAATITGQHEGFTDTIEVLVVAP